jgi:hypothetical protein
MLVLAATYNSRLGNLVEKPRLADLLDCIIKFLGKHSAISPTLRKDAEILTDVKTKLFDNKTTNNSGSLTQSLSSSVEM